jgi:hypothetical protein
VRSFEKGKCNSLPKSHLAAPVHPSRLAPSSPVSLKLFSCPLSNLPRPSASNDMTMGSNLEGPMDHLYRALAIAMLLFLSVSCAAAQETCLLYQRGTVECPGYGAPAATAVPGPSMDAGVATVPLGSSVSLFKGQTPPNGFMIRIWASGGSNGANYLNCFVSDNSPAGLGVGFYMLLDSNAQTVSFISPAGYKPIGPVSIYCQYISSPIPVLYLSARGW